MHLDPRYPSPHAFGGENICSRLLGIFQMKGFLISVGIVAALYFADQQFTAGKYTTAVGRMATQMRHSFGV
jgi:hypothetical protein